MNPLTIGILVISFFSAIAIVLGFILFDMIKNGTTYSRKIPLPPKHLMPNQYRANQIEVIDAEIVVNKKNN